METHPCPKLNPPLSRPSWTVAAARLAAVLLAGGLPLLGVAGVAQADEDISVDTDAVERATVWEFMQLPATVTVPIDGQDVEYQTVLAWNCSGFFLSPDGYIGTAGHCVLTDDESAVNARNNIIPQLIEQGYEVNGDGSNYNWKVTYGKLVTYIGQPAGKNQLPILSAPQVVRAVDQQPFMEGDNALLQLANVSDMPTLPIAPAKLATRDAVVYAGFPGNVRAITDMGRQPVTFKDARVASLSTTNGGVPIIQLDASIASGMSGGPAMTNAGVIGMNSGGFNGTSESFVTDTEMLLKFLQKNGVDFRTSTDSEAEAPMLGAGWIVPVLIGLVVLLGAGVAVLIILLARQRSNSRSGAPQTNAAAAQQPTVSPPPTTPTPPNQPPSDQASAPPEPPATPGPPNPQAQP